MPCDDSDYVCTWHAKLSNFYKEKKPRQEAKIYDSRLTALTRPLPAPARGRVRGLPRRRVHLHHLVVLVVVGQPVRHQTVTVPGLPRHRLAAWVHRTAAIVKPVPARSSPATWTAPLLLLLLVHVLQGVLIAQNWRFAAGTALLVKVHHLGIPAEHATVQGLSAHCCGGIEERG